MAAGPYPEETRMLGAWALRCMLRLLRLPVPCVLICDEFARLGVQDRAALDLLSLGRELGKPVILCSQGPPDFGELSAHALDQAAQDVAWLLAFRQGTRDSVTACRLLGVRWAEERSWSTGRETRKNVRIVDQPYVSVPALEDLEPGTAHLRVPSVDGRRTRVEPVRVTLPSMVGHGRAGSPTRRKEAEIPALPHDEVVHQTSYPAEAASRPEPALDEMPAMTRTLSAYCGASTTRASRTGNAGCGQRSSASHEPARHVSARTCPEADPACKDPSRAYWLPSHGGGVTGRHAMTGHCWMPALCPNCQQSRDMLMNFGACRQRSGRRTTDSDHRRGDAYMQ
jgi:hypothetical protein